MILVPTKLTVIKGMMLDPPPANFKRSFSDLKAIAGISKMKSHEGGRKVS